MNARDNAYIIAQEVWNRLSHSERWELGDALVLGSFDWRDYWKTKPSKEVLQELDKIRMLWEETQ